MRKKLVGSVLIVACLVVAAWAVGQGSAVPGCSVDFSSSTVDGSTLWTDIKMKTGQSAPENCNFHDLAWNNFLYLVGDDGSGHPRFMSFAPWYDLLPATGTPTWKGSYQPLQPIEIVKSNVQQLEGEAGDNFELLDVASRASGYDMRVNQAFFDYSTQKKLYTKTGLSNAANAFNDAGDADGGVWLPTGSSTAVGAIEIKTAWRSYGSTAGACPSSIMHCEQAADGGWWGLVGMHLVQKTPTRGELVWASFEHVANAPDCSPTATVLDPNGQPVPPPSGTAWPATNPIAKLPPDPVTGGTIAQGWNYFDYATYQSHGGDGKSCTFPDDKNQQATGHQCNTDPVTKISQGVLSFMRIDACRTDALPAVDADDCQTNVANALNVSCLNASVLANFPAGLETKWKYYQSIGAEWMNMNSVPTTGCFTYTPDGPTCPPKTAAPYPGYPQILPRTGSKDLANTTMETWMQKGMAGIYQAVDSNGNPTTATYVATDCFGCHQPISTSWGEGDTSHIFTKTTQQ